MRPHDQSRGHARGVRRREEGGERHLRKGGRLARAQIARCGPIEAEHAEASRAGVALEEAVAAEVGQLAEGWQLAGADLARVKYRAPPTPPALGGAEQLDNLKMAREGRVAEELVTVQVRMLVLREDDGQLTRGL